MALHIRDLHYLMFNGKAGSLSIYDDGDTPDDYSDDTFISTHKAYNKVDSKSKGKWEDGEFDMKDTDKAFTHGEQKDKNGIKKDSEGGSYGEDGIFRAKDFTETTGNKEKRTNMGVHAGRKGKKDGKGRSNEKYATMGCVRTNKQAMKSIKKAIKKHGSLTKIIVKNNRNSTNSNKVKRIDPNQPKQMEIKKVKEIKL